MKSNRKTRKKALADLNYLELTPIPIHPHSLSENGTVTVLIPKVTSPWATRYLLPLMRHPIMKLNLDEIGTATWLLLDGQRNVSQVCEQLVLRFGDSIQPVEERVTKFLSRLYVHKIISFKEIS